MTTKIIMLLAVLVYSVIVSQSFMYMLTLKQTQLNLGANTYTEIRKLIDAGMRVNFKYVLYAALIINIALLAVTIKNPGSLLFITASITLIALIADTLLTVKGNLPINDIINTWRADSYPANWAEWRTKWFQVFQWRQVANIAGFISLLVGVIFGSK